MSWASSHWSVSDTVQEGPKLLTDANILDILAFKRTSEAAKKDEASQTIEASHSAILGPFYRHGVAVQPNGTTIVRQFEKDADYTRLFGTVYDAEGKPLKGAMVDIWHDVSPLFASVIPAVWLDNTYVLYCRLQMDCTMPRIPQNHKIIVVDVSRRTRMVDTKRSVFGLHLTLSRSIILRASFCR